MELLQNIKNIDVVYVPIGLGSGICAMLAARDALKLQTEVVGVVSAHASAYAKSFSAGHPVESAVTTQLSDGMACRVPEPEALELILQGVDRIVQVSDDEVAAAMRIMFECTHNVCEGAGAAALAAAKQEKARIHGRRVAVIATGGNVDKNVFAQVLSQY
jgi:threonine dehydratase